MKITNRRPRRLIIVSNRLPFSIAKTNEGIEYRETTGGLVTGLTSFLASMSSDPAGPPEYLWVGWPGATVEPSGRSAITSHVLKHHQSLPVYLSEEEMEQFYFGFCNKTVWPLFHSFPSFTEFDERMWESYKSVNLQFCDALVGVLGPDDIVWIHDYHLLLLPLLLRERVPAAHIGFFLHIPFPSFEIFRLLPSSWRKDILNGMLGADLVGFHTYDYTQHFLQSVLRILGHGNTIGQILLPERGVRADTFPMGIDYERFSAAVGSTDVQAEISRLRVSFGDARIILSADRLDYTKGIINRLSGFDLFLEQHPQYLEKIVLALVVVPSRIGVQQYDLMKRQVEEQVGRINGKYGTIGWTPVVYQYRYMPLVPLVALYAVSDVAMVTPLRDGMNLVAKEYIASRTGGTGVLILSEMAGAAKELGEAVLVNPNHAGEIASSIDAALSIPPEEQARRLRIMQARLQRNTVNRWAMNFLRATVEAVQSKSKLATTELTGDVRRVLLSDYRRSPKRLVLLDYDGTLMPFASDHASARPTPKVLSLLRRLADDEGTTVVIISGRDRDTLERWFEMVPVRLVAEHGFFTKTAGDEWRSMRTIPGDWKRLLLPILQRFADRLPGASVEEKEFSLVWHYRAADPEQGEPFAHELVDNLNSLTGSVDVQVVQANKAIEVRVAGVNKGTVAREIVAEGAYEFVLAIGDDRTDEDLFAALPEWAHSVKVGSIQSQAKYNCRDVDEVHRVLSMLAQRGRKRDISAGVVGRTMHLIERIVEKVSGQ